MTSILSIIFLLGIYKGKIILNIKGNTNENVTIHLSLYDDIIYQCSVYV